MEEEQFSNSFLPPLLLGPQQYTRPLP